MGMSVCVHYSVLFFSFQHNFSFHTQVKVSEKAVVDSVLQIYKKNTIIVVACCCCCYRCSTTVVDVDDEI